MATLNRPEGLTVAELTNKTRIGNCGEVMERPATWTEPLTIFPVEYWQTDASICGALADDLREHGLLMLSIRDIPAGTKLHVRIFYANEYELDWITVAGSIVSKGHHSVNDWKGHEYRLQFDQISKQDLLKLKGLLNDPSEPEHIPGRQERVALGSSLGETVIPELPDSDPNAAQSANCRFYKDGKCLKTTAFCDLCQTADETVISEMVNSAKKSRNRRSRPLTSALIKLSGNLKSAFRSN